MVLIGVLVITTLGGGAVYLSQASNLRVVNLQPTALPTATRFDKLTTSYPQATAAQASAKPINPTEPVGLASYPDKPLGATLPEPLSMKDVIGHRSALHGKTIRVKGVVVATLLGEKACGNTLGQGNTVGPGMCAQPRIFIADSQDKNRDPHYDVQVLLPEDTKDTAYTVGQQVVLRVVVTSSTVAVSLRKVDY